MRLLRLSTSDSAIIRLEAATFTQVQGIHNHFLRLLRTGTTLICAVANPVAKIRRITIAGIVPSMTVELLHGLAEHVVHACFLKTLLAVWH